MDSWLHTIKDTDKNKLKLRINALMTRLEEIEKVIQYSLLT